MNPPPPDRDPRDLQLSSLGATESLGPRRKETELAFLSPPGRPDSLGRIGHYEVLELLGRGGFGIVMRAFDEVLQRVVAVKVLAPEMAVTSPARKRFLREARSSARIRHDNVVQVHAIEEEPLPYLVMEFIPGLSLQQRMDSVGPLPPEEAVQVGVQIARGLAAAHEKGLIHRDVKPGNVLLEKGVEGRVKLTDFGLARAADDASLTQSGMVAGTPEYMAPEQACGEALDHRADLFSLGTVLYAMVSGRLPFRAANSIAVLKRVCEDTPRPIREIIPEVPAWLCGVIAKLHAKSPADRYQSASEVVEALLGQLPANPPPKTLPDGRAVVAPARGDAPPPDPRAADLTGLRDELRREPADAPRRHARKFAMVGGAVVLALLAAAGGILWATRNLEPAGPGPTAPPPGTPPGGFPQGADLALRFEDREHQVVAPALERHEDTPVTLECWLNRPGPTNTYRTVLALGGKAAVWIAHTDQDAVAPVSLRIPPPPKNFQELGGKVRFGAWQHVALVYDGQRTRFYVDGKLQSESPRLDPPSKHARVPAGGLIVGGTRYVTNGQATFGGYYVGLMDEIRVSKTARYAGEGFTPRRRFEPDPDTLALYHCDEGKGEALTDASGKGNHATLGGATWVEVGP